MACLGDGMYLGLGLDLLFGDLDLTLGQQQVHIGRGYVCSQRHHGGVIFGLGGAVSGLPGLGLSGHSAEYIDFPIEIKT